ncbi:MAG: glutamate 5-kinase [Armatimonadetes bacterium]|nr:glutamate 5-kinase [Armatimonadota bacterium]
MEEARRAREKLAQARRIVIKVGTRLVTKKGAGLNEQFIDGLADQIAELRARDMDVMVVTSGAVHLGRRLLDHRGRGTVRLRQAMAALGQPELMRAYSRALGRHNLLAAQLLLTADDMIHRERYLNARNTIETLLREGVVPIINENDSVSIEGVTVTFGENDRLAALVAVTSRADAAIFLSDQRGLLAGDPRRHPDASLVPVVHPGDEVDDLAGKAGGPESAGGMEKKIAAARLASSCGIIVVIADGREPQVVSRLLQGEEIGTIFVPSPALEAKKAWLATTAQPAGEVVVDEGAVRALLQADGASLLPVGIVEVKGEFKRGDLVILRGPDGREIARGITNYDAEDLDVIKGHRTRDLEALLGRRGDDAAVHRDYRVVTAQQE